MYIHSKPAAAFYKLALGALALFLEWFILSQFGWTALRFFSTWVLFLSAIYFLSSALQLAMSDRNGSGKNPCPMLEGMIILAFFLISGTVISAQANGFALPNLAIWVKIFVAGVLPILTLLDWILFVQKGRFTVMMPFYWLALPLCYVATMIFTAELLPATVTYRYPLEMLNYLEFGWYQMFLLMLIIAIVCLAVGYVLFLSDFALSGKLAKKIVMLHIRTVEVGANDEKTENPSTPIGVSNSEAPKIEIDIAAKEALEEIKEIANDEPVAKTTDKEPAQPEEVEVTTHQEKPAETKVADHQEGSQREPKHPKTGKATDIEVIRIRVNGNKSGKKPRYNGPKPHNQSNGGNPYHSRKKKTKKRR